MQIGTLFSNRILTINFMHNFQTTAADMSCSLGDLEAATEYEIRVAAVNKFGTGDFSEPISVETPSQFGKEWTRIPTDIRAVRTSDGNRRLSKYVLITSKYLVILKQST